MKTLTINTFVVALSLSLCWTPSMAAAAFSGQSVNQSEQHTISATAAPSPTPFYALNRINAQSLAAQAMTDQELQAVEGGASMVEYAILMMAMMVASSIRSR
jgi:hypothetical protein